MEYLAPLFLVIWLNIKLHFLSINMFDVSNFWTIIIKKENL